MLRYKEDIRFDVRYKKEELDFLRMELKKMKDSLDTDELTIEEKKDLELKMRELKYKIDDKEESLRASKEKLGQEIQKGEK